MELRSLGYMGISSSYLDDWTTLATRTLGMQQVDSTSGTRLFRMDDRKQRFAVSEKGDVPHYLGWEVENRTALDGVASRLDNLGIAVTRCARSLADERFVSDLISFADPAGNRLEIFCGPEISTDAFIPGRPISGFRTGPLGMGHVVVNVDNLDLLLPFYRDVLGFRVSDFRRGPVKLYFFHLNSRHHSFAMVETGKTTPHHVMVELGSLDDVGQGYDLSVLEPDQIALTLGRHSNDYMTSFYLKSPSGFFIEYGWGGRDIDVDTWQPYESSGPTSLWGHDRLHLPPDKRSEMRREMLDYAAKGMRAPIPDVNCGWLKSVIR